MIAEVEIHQSEQPSNPAAEREGKKRKAKEQSPEPSEFVNGVLYIFPFLVRDLPTAANPTPRAYIIEIPAETRREAQHVLSADDTLIILKACSGRPHPDLFLRQVFDTQMARAYLGVTEDAFKKLPGNKIARAANGAPWYTRRRLNQLACAQGEEPES